jgi:chromate reductase
MSDLKILAISGSLRHASFNTYALKAAAELAPAGMTVEIFDISAIPPYNEDVKAKGFPAPVEALRAAIKSADALLLSSPEYNFSYSGVLKNAIDWASRPPEQPFDGKPIAIMGAGPGALGTARAQYHLRQVFIFLNAHVLNRPEVMISGAATRFDAAGKLTDEATRTMVRSQMEALRDWTLRRRR